jgi:hypothetical protein
MISEWLGADPRRCGWSPERDRERPRAWEALLSELAARPPEHGLVKLQVTGPATLACALERERGGAPSRREALALATELASWLAANVAEQVRALGERGFDALLVVDEPALGVFGVRRVEAAWEPLRAVAPAWVLLGVVGPRRARRARPAVLRPCGRLHRQARGDGARAAAGPRHTPRLGNPRRPPAGTRAPWRAAAELRPRPRAGHGRAEPPHRIVRDRPHGAPTRERRRLSLAALAANRRAAPPDPPRPKGPWRCRGAGRASSTWAVTPTGVRAESAAIPWKRASRLRRR